MPFSRPTISRLIARAKADIESELQNGAAYIRRTFEAAAAKMQAGLAHTLHGHIAWAARQLLPDTSEDEYLVRHANIWLGENSRTPATKAEFPITVTGTVANTPVPSGTRWSRADGVSFESFDAYALPAAVPFEVTVTVRAVEAGQEGNTIPGSTLTMESSIVGVNAEATVDGAGSTPVGDGANQETIEALRTRTLERIQSPPTGGGPDDYVAWAKTISGITRAWELPRQLGPGTVLVLVVQDTFDEDGNFIETLFPGAAKVEEVADYIESEAPVTAVVTVQAPVEQQLNPQIEISPYTPEVEEQITLQLQDLILREAAPDGTLPLSKINEAVSLATGEEDHNLLSPAADVVSGPSQLLTLGTPVYTELA